MGRVCEAVQRLDDRSTPRPLRWLDRWLRRPRQSKALTKRQRMFLLVWLSVGWLVLVPLGVYFLGMGSLSLVFGLAASTFFVVSYRWHELADPAPGTPT